MLRKVLIICAFFGLSFNIFANAAPKEYQLPLIGASMEYTFQPQETQVFINVFYWVVRATCVISSEQESNRILVKFLKKTGSVNDTQLKAGDEIEMDLHDKDELHMVSNPGSKVELTNLSDGVIKAVCTSM